jgi:bacteriorhodopsin
LNPDDDFQEADRLHLQEQRLVGIVILLAVALLFLTLAHITQSFLRYIFVTIGLFAFLAALVIGAVIEVAALLQQF